jgi:nitrogenase molybdenum-iron protein alpha/beta subunit
MLEDYTPRSNFSYLIGVYLAVNAVPDAYLYVDGPDCTFYKAQFIHGKHDLNSTLIDAAGNHRIRMSDVTVNQVVVDRTEMLTKSVQVLDRLDGCSLVLLTSMPMATITGTQYDLLIRGIQPSLDKPLIEVPSLSLSGDWLDGYARTLTALAGSIELTGKSSPDKVAIIGYMMDRNERDHTANVGELERMVRALGLDPVSVWLSGRPLSHLSRAGEAGTIISLPHGRQAARIIADRTGAKLVELGLPFGLKPTVDWLATLGDELDRSQEAGIFIERELGEVVPAIQWLVPKYLMGTRVLFSGDPHLFEPAAEFLAELGCDTVGLVAVGRKAHLDPVPETLADMSIPLLFEANPYDLERLISTLPEGESLDLAIQSDTFGWKGQGDYVVMPFGCACYWWHAIYDAPYLGFSGALSFVDRMVNRLMVRYQRRK